MTTEMLEKIDTLVGKRGRSTFLARAAEKELIRMRQKAALREAAGAWSEADHPELRDGIDEYVRGLRQESERRYEKQQ